MISKELEAVEAVEAGDSDSCRMSEQFPMTIESSSLVQNQNGRSQGEQELQRKLRSIKLSRSPSKRRSKHRSNDASVDNLQKSDSVLIRRSSFKAVKNLTRMPSVKFKNPLMRKSSGGTQLNNMNKSRTENSSIKYKSSSPNFLKETCCSNERKTQFQGSPRSSESSYCSTSNSTPNSAHKSARLSGTKSKTCSIRQLSDSGVQRATCSSALKHSKSPEVTDLEAEGSESEGVSAKKPCPFTYCSLHGHHHAAVPPLKTLISKRRRLLKTQKQATRSPLRVKKSGKIKEDEMSQLVSIGNDQVHGTSLVVEKLGGDVSLEIYEDKYDGPKAKPGGDDLSNLFEKLLAEASEESLQQTNDLVTVEHALVSPNPLGDLSLERSFSSQGTNTHIKEEKLAASYNNEGADSSCTDKPAPDEVVESTSDGENHKTCSTYYCEVPEEQTAIEQNNASVEKIKSERVERSVQAKNHKYIRMWQLMYKHAVKGSTADVESTLTLDGENKEDQVEGTNSVLETNKSFPETDKHTALINHSAGDQKFELCHQDAIDLVQEAFDKILLPEVQDSSYDDQSVTSGISSDQEGFLLRNDEGGEPSNSTFSDSSEDRMAQNLEETWLEAENSDAPKEEKAVSKVEDKLEQNTPKHWSSLKKFILLKRFVKAIEKVRNLNYQKPQYLPLDRDPESEKVILRRQEIEDKKNADEWMLDFALQQVISKLPPAQQRRVALLVEAFETVLPFPDIRTRPMSKAIDSTEAELQACNGLSMKNADETDTESDSGTYAKILLGNMSCPEENLNEYPDQCIDIQMDHEQSPVKSSMLEDSNAEDCCIKPELDVLASGTTNEDEQGTHVSINTGDGDNTVVSIFDATGFTNISPSEIKDSQFCKETSLKQDEDGSTSYEVLENKTDQEIPTEHISIKSLEPGNMNFKVESSNGETSKLITDTGELSNLSEDLVITSASIEHPEELMTEREGLNGGGTTEKSGFIQGSPPLEESHSDSSTDVTHITQLEKQNYTRLWYFVYKHLVSSIAEKDGDEPPDGADEEQGDDTNTLPPAEMDPELRLTNRHADNKRNELRRIETIKLVEKAIDEILLPENQDESEDEPSNAGHLVPDQEPVENKVGMGGKSSISTFSNFANDSFREFIKNEAEEDPEKLFIKSDNAIIEEEEKAVLKVEEKPKQQMSKNWRNLKKMILLNRFIKALEKGKKSNPRGPKYLLLEPDPEADRVHLKHQNVDERKNAEEWMLDYALQKAVAKLTPARNRKVALLVEAFETVIPNNRIPNPFKPEIIR